nr:hypothetical protein [Trichocoleus sp. FACHB-40]
MISGSTPSLKFKGAVGVDDKTEKKFTPDDIGKVNSENRDIIKTQYQAGKTAFERGEYRQSVQHLEKASSLVARNSRLGGEVQIWLVTAYEAAGQRTEAIALLKQLFHHPDPEISKQSRRLLYIMEAPQLSRRPEWLSEIPDLTALAESQAEFRGASNVKPANTTPRKRPEPELEPVDLSKVNTQDNRFIWVALIAIILTLGSLAWWSL